MALGTPLGQISIKGYADGEIGIQIQESVRGQDCYIVQPTCPPRVNDALMQLFLLISTFRRAAARTITAVIPYYGRLGFGNASNAELMNHDSLHLETSLTNISLMFHSN